MLAVATPFPMSGSTAYLRPTGAECRIIRRNADETALVSLADRPRDASGNRTIPLAELAETEAEALAPKPRRQRRSAR